MTQDRIAEIGGFVEEAVTTIFGAEARFGPIYMGSAVDRDGFEYVTAAVIYESADGKLDPAKRLDVLNRVADRVLEADDKVFPSISYIVKHEEREWLDGR